MTNLTSILLPNILRQEDNINQDNKVKFKKQRPSIVMQLLSRYINKKIEDANSSEISEYMIFKKKADTEYDKIRKRQTSYNYYASIKLFDIFSFSRSKLDF